MPKLDRKILDETGVAIVKAATLSSREIEKVTSNPALFDGIRARIKVGPGRPAPRRLAGRKVVAFASIAMVAAAVLTLVVFRPKPTEIVRQPAPAQPIAKPAAKYPEPDKVISTDLPRATNATPRIERISTRPETKVNRPKQSAAQQIRYEDDFYALSYAGDPNETERGGRIVRVDIPRSTLFAMGVDVPLENETESVKADLLIGSDGVTRAIRVVK